jgi:hypothetical protein
MSKLAPLLVQLQTERKRMQAELQQLDNAIRALSGLNRRSGAARPQRILSVAARRRIAAAQRARWAKVRQQKKAEMK